MSKRVYLLILFLITFGYARNAYTTFLLTNDVLFILTVIWGVFGWVYFKNESVNYLNTAKNRAVVWWLMIIMMLSLFMPYFKYDQSIFEAFLSQRYNYLILLLLLFYRINISYDDFVYALRICSYLSLGCFVLSIFQPNFFVEQSTLIESMYSRIEHSSTDIGYAAPGFRLMIFYLYIKIAQLFDNADFKTIAETSLFMLYVIMYQNRSTILGTFPFFAIAFLFVKSEKKIFVWTIGIVVVFMLFPFLNEIYESLTQETQIQLNDDNYPRWQAIYVFLYESKSNIVEYLLGSGIWSKTGVYSTMMTNAAGYRGAQISDIGWLGTFYYYGITPLIILFAFVKNAISNISIPYFLKFYALYIIFVPTIHGFLLNALQGNIQAMIFIYFTTYFSTYTNERYRLQLR